jgi:hypothetical protein
MKKFLIAQKVTNMGHAIAIFLACRFDHFLIRNAFYIFVTLPEQTLIQSEVDVNHTDAK